jgi:hypothetical protein
VLLAAAGPSPTPLWIPIAAALVGALVGGGVSLLGSAWVTARAQRRERRVLVHLELLPEFFGHLERFSEALRHDQAGRPSELTSRAYKLERLALVTGAQDHAHAQVVVGAAQEVGEVPMEDPKGRIGPARDLKTALDRYDTFLRSKVG